MTPVAELQALGTDPAARQREAVEFDLLLQCCGQRPSSDISNGAETFFDVCDWNRFINLAEHHGLIPLVYKFFSSHPEQLPVQHFAELRSKYAENARKSVWFTSELIRVVKHLEAQGIKAVPYKGPALAQILYGDVTARQFGDLDILIRAQDLGTAKNALATTGYRPSFGLNAREESAYISAGYEYPFDGAAGSHLLELQWRILPRFYSVDFDMAGFFQRTEQVRLAGCSVPSLSTDDLLLVLCVHAAKHVWAQVSGLCDIANLARYRRIDWDAAWQRATELGIRRIVALNFLLAQDLLDAALPNPIERWVDKDLTCQILKTELLRIIKSSLYFDTESLAYFRLMIRLRECIADKTRMMRRLIWTPGMGEWSAIRIPGKLSSLYRLVRLARLAGRITVRRQPCAFSEAPVKTALTCGNAASNAVDGRRRSI